MSTTICFANNKGGVGKTTLTMNLGGALSDLGKKTLLVDLDAQANLSSVFADPSRSSSPTISDLIYEDLEISAAIQTTKLRNLAIIPASAQLQDMDSRLAGDDDAQFFSRRNWKPSARTTSSY